MKGVILQPSYIPWRGYFELIYNADVFIFLDDVQYTRRDWRNRNQVKTPHGIKWLTVPVVKEGRDGLLIKDVKIDNSLDWNQKHMETLKHCYSKADFFAYYWGIVVAMYDRRWNNLCELDIEFTIKIAEILGIEHTRFMRSSDLNIKGQKSDKLVAICDKVGITTYISGPSGANYINEDPFKLRNIKLIYHRYEYPEYPQLHGNFQPNVTVLDLLFNCGAKSKKYIWQLN